MSVATVSPFSKRCTDLINEQINKELTAGYAYHALSIYFGRNDVALSNISSFFANAAKEEQEHADMFVSYLQKRGSEVKLQAVQAPDSITTLTLIEAFTLALNFEKSVSDSINTIYAAAEEENEAHLASFLDENFLGEQVDEEDKYVRIIATIKRMGPGLGEQLFDKDVIGTFE